MLSESPAPAPVPLELPRGRCLLFAYGQLQPRQRPPQTLSRAWPDRVRGLLYDLGPYPGAIRIGAADKWIAGYVLEIDETELTTRLDAYEGVGEGLYRRIRTVTEAAHDVWIYEFARPLPLNAKGPIERWPVETNLDR